MTKKDFKAFDNRLGELIEEYVDWDNKLWKTDKYKAKYYKVRDKAVKLIDKIKGA